MPPSLAKLTPLRVVTETLLASIQSLEARDAALGQRESQYQKRLAKVSEREVEVVDREHKLREILKKLQDSFCELEIERARLSNAKTMVKEHVWRLEKSILEFNDWDLEESGQVGRGGRGQSGKSPEVGLDPVNPDSVTSKSGTAVIPTISTIPVNTQITQIPKRTLALHPTLKAILDEPDGEPVVPLAASPHPPHHSTTSTPPPMLTSASSTSTSPLAVAVTSPMTLAPSSSTAYTATSANASLLVANRKAHHTASATASMHMPMPMLKVADAPHQQPQNIISLKRGSSSSETSASGLKKRSRISRSTENLPSTRAPALRNADGPIIQAPPPTVAPKKQKIAKINHPRLPHNPSRILIRRFCRKLLDTLYINPLASFIREPINEVLQSMSDPPFTKLFPFNLCLNDINDRLAFDYYANATSVNPFLADMRLMLGNIRDYFELSNKRDHHGHATIVNLISTFESKVEKSLNNKDFAMFKVWDAEKERALEVSKSTVDSSLCDVASSGAAAVIESAAADPVVAEVVAVDAQPTMDETQPVAAETRSVPETHFGTLSPTENQVTVAKAEPQRAVTETEPLFSDKPTPVPNFQAFHLERSAEPTDDTIIPNAPALSVANKAIPIDGDDDEIMIGTSTTLMKKSRKAGPLAIVSPEKLPVTNADVAIVSPGYPSNAEITFAHHPTLDPATSIPPI